MVTRLEAIAGKAKSLFCSGLQLSGQFADNFAPFFTGFTVPGKIANAIYSLACNKPPSSYTYPGASQPPFTGGQCQNIQYTVIVDGTYLNPQGQPSSTSIALGQFTTRPIGQIKGARFATDDGSTYYAEVEDRDGWYRRTNLPFSAIPGSPQVTAITCIREGGGADDCGDPPPLPPGSPAPVTFPNEQIDYTDDDGNPQSETNDWTFYPPYIDISDNLSIDIDIGDLNLTLKLYPDFSVRPRLPSPEPEDGDIEGDQNITEDPNEDLEQKGLVKYIGVRIYANKLSSADVTTIFQDDVPDLQIPRVANVYFRHDFTTGKNWTNAIECKNLRAYIPVQGVLPANDIKVEFAPGFTGYFVKVPEPKKPQT